MGTATAARLAGLHRALESSYDHMAELAAANAALRGQLHAASENLHRMRAKAAALDEIAAELDLPTDDPVQLALFVAGQKHGLIELADENATLRTQIAGPSPEGDQ